MTVAAARQLPFHLNGLVLNFVRIHFRISGILHDTELKEGSHK